MSGIYKFTNKLNGKIYIGSSKNLAKRFSQYFNISYISTVKNKLTISRALIKYGYFNFSIEILEYCDPSMLLNREQHYIDELKPTYNIAKIAGSTLGVHKSEEAKNNKSKALKGVYVGEKSSLYGRTASGETKLLMREAKLGSKNAMFGKTQSIETKKLQSLARVGKINSIETKNAIDIANGTPIYLYASCSNVENSFFFPKIFFC